MAGERKQYRRTITILVGVLSVIVPLGVVATPSLGQTARPSIAFLNPSSFAAAGERGIIVSDAKPDAGPGCCGAAMGRYRLSAWVANAPVDARVYFAVAQRTVDVEITSTRPSSENTWEAQWSIPSEILDGPATLYAYLIVGDQPIAVDEQDVTIMRVQENAQLTYPAAGGSFGTYRPLATALPEGEAIDRKLPMGIVDALYTATPEMVYVRTFYTTSAPGATPVWKVCGTEAISSSNTSPHNGVRCTLADAADQSKITALAAVANDSQDEYEVRFNQSGDAVPIAEPYIQEPSDLSFSTNGAQRVNREENSEHFFCSTNELVTLSDQNGRQVAGANVDVHATGPSDSLKFHAPLVLSRAADAPDRGSHAIEPAFDCTSAGGLPPPNAQPDEQAEHQRFGAPDRKHVESLPAGTNDVGQFQFRMYSTGEGVTEYTVWVDELDDGCKANDDAFTSGELSVTGSIGWAQDPTFAVPQPLEALVPCVPAAPDPDPNEDPEVIDGSRAVTLRLAKGAVLGRPGTFKGRIDAVEAVCERNKRVVLKMRKPGGSFHKIEAARTARDGRYAITHTVRAPRDYRVVAPASTSCERARSEVLRLRR